MKASGKWNRAALVLHLVFKEENFWAIRITSEQTHCQSWEVIQTRKTLMSTHSIFIVKLHLENSCLLESTYLPLTFTVQEAKEGPFWGVYHASLPFVGSAASYLIVLPPDTQGHSHISWYSQTSFQMEQTKIMTIYLGKTSNPIYMKSILDL